MQQRSILGATLILAVATACGGNRGLPVTPSPALQALQRPNATQTPVVELDTRSRGATVSRDLYGASLDTWYDFLRGFVNPSLHRSGIHLVRFPGGSESDAYHWEEGGSLCDNQGYITPSSTFDHLMKRVAEPLKIDIAITLNYGSNRACNAGGRPSEAAAWVAHARSRGYHVAFWTVGNEVYGSWEYDLHAHPHDPHTYSAAVRTGYYPAVKKADPRAKVGVVVDTPSDRAWNDVVLREAQPFDFVEVHYYPEYNKDSDRFLLGCGDRYVRFRSRRPARRDDGGGCSESTPIYLGEYNNDAGNEGKQSVSIVNGLFVGQMLGTLANAGVPMSTFWLAYGSCDQNGDFSKKLYGWQDFGTEALFSDDLPEYGCSGCAHDSRRHALPDRAGDGAAGRRGSRRLPSSTDDGSALAAPGRSRLRLRRERRLRAGRLQQHAAHDRRRGASEGIDQDALPPRSRRMARHSTTSPRTTNGSARGSANLGSVGASVPLALPPYSVSVLTLKYRLVILRLRSG